MAAGSYRCQRYRVSLQCVQRLRRAHVGILRFCPQSFLQQVFVFAFSCFFSLSPLHSELLFDLSVHVHCTTCIWCSKTELCLLKAVKISPDDSSYWLWDLHVYFTANMLICKYSAIMAKTILLESISYTDCNKYAYNSSFIRLLRQMRPHKKYNPH